MYALQLSSVPRWAAVADKWCPQSVDTLCPHCGRFVNLTFDQHQYDQARTPFLSGGQVSGL